jgi:hypothetical protein
LYRISNKENTMKKAALFLFVSVACFAQVTWQVCVKVTRTGVPSEQCQSIGPATVNSIQAAIADSAPVLSQNEKGEQVRGAPLYRGVANFIFVRFRSDVLQNTVDKYPSPAVQKLKDAAEAAAVAARNGADAALPTVPVQEP